MPNSETATVPAVDTTTKGKGKDGKGRGKKATGDGARVLRRPGTTNTRKDKKEELIDVPLRTPCSVHVRRSVSAPQPHMAYILDGKARDKNRYVFNCNEHTTNDSEEHCKSMRETINRGELTTRRECKRWSDDQLAEDI